MSEIEIKNKCTEAQKLASRNYYQKNKEQCRQKVLSYMKDKYKNDEEYRTKTLERANERYRLKKLEQQEFDEKMKILNDVKTSNENTLKSKEISDYVDKLYFQMFLLHLQKNKKV
jgi:hypothetical protein